MNENQYERIDFESYFDIDKISFKNVSGEFENKFREAYKDSLQKMSNDEDGIADATGAISLGILEKIAKRLTFYDKNSNFEQTYYALEKEEDLLN